MPFPMLPFRLVGNPAATPGAAYGARQAAMLNGEALAEARRCISGWPGYAPTPLIELSGLARELGIARLFYKQEADRFGLRSFKPLGGAYAVQRCLMREVAARTGRSDVTAADILKKRYPDIVSQITVTAATDGNHGRSVAWGAKMFGCRCVIYVNEAVSQAREQAIARFGAEMRRHPGSFDDAVREAFAVARREGWSVIPDTSDGDVVDAPRDVTQGYAVLAAETIEQLPGGEPPSHLFLQAGVGGLAAAVCSEFWRRFGADRPRTVLVEPRQAACWLASLENRRPTEVTGDVDSFMGGLSCGTVSKIAWEILEPGADAAIAIDDRAAEATMRLLAAGSAGDPPLVAGESGVAGLAGLITATGDEAARDKLALDGTAQVVVVGSEGATDEDMYRTVVGRDWREVAA